MNLVKLQFKIDSPSDYDLNLTLKPSFVSSLYVEKDKYEWVKQVGTYADNLTLKQEGDTLIASSTKLADEESLRRIVLCESGLWDEAPSARISRLRGPLKEQVKALAELFPGVRLSIAPHDFNCILISVILSKRAKYDVFVRKWVRALWAKWHCDLSFIANLTADDIKSIGTSYQLIDLTKTLKDFLRLKPKLDDVIELRKSLMSCWGIGPKVADAIILFATPSPWVVPCDTHLQRISRRLGWIEKDVRLPAKSLCLKYHCDECVDKYGSCLKVIIENMFPGFGGWIQTLTYLFGSSICSSQAPKCHLCHPTLREYCRERRS